MGRLCGAGAVTRGASLLALALAGAAAAEGIPVPSGQPVERIEVIEEAAPDGLVLRYRFLAPEAGALEFEARMADMAHLCDTVALPELRAAGQEPRRVVVSLSEKAVEFGVRDATVAQFFEAYTIGPERCIWEAF